MLLLLLLLQVVALRVPSVVHQSARPHLPVDVTDCLLPPSVECLDDGAADRGSLHRCLVPAHSASLRNSQFCVGWDVKP